MRATRVATASSGDGVMNLFVVTKSHGLLGNTYTEPGKWSKWRDLRPTAPAVDVAATVTGTNRVEVFYVDTSGQLWWGIVSEDRHPNWAKVPGNPGIGPIGALSALSGWMGHREIYAVGEHGKVAHIWRWDHRDWDPWYQADSPVPHRDVALSVPAPGLLECWSVGLDGRIRNRWYVASGKKDRWSAWSDGFGSGHPSSARAIDALNGWPDHQEIFVVRADGGISHRDHWQGRDWPAWRDLDAPSPASDIAAGVTSTGHLEVIAVDQEGSVWQKSYADEVWWSPWRPVPGFAPTVDRVPA